MGYKVLIKRPDEKVGHMTWIAGHLENLQTHVEGHIEVVTICTDPRVVVIMNEEGKLKNLEKNFWMGSTPGFRDMIRGTVVVCGVDGEEFANIPIDRPTWKALLKSWGNEV